MATAKQPLALACAIFSLMVSMFQGLMVGTPQPPAAPMALVAISITGGVGAVTGKGRDAIFCTGAHQNIVIGHIGVGFGVVQVHRTHRACKEGVLEAFTKQLHVGVRRAALTQGVHVHTDLGPFIIIADGGIAHALGTGAGIWFLQATPLHTGQALQYLPMHSRALASTSQDKS